MVMEQITTLTFFKYSRWYSKLWAFGMMPVGYVALSGVRGQSFYKLMGSGRGIGFHPLPDWSVYALMQVWDTETDALRFFDQHSFIRNCQKQAGIVTTIYLKNIFSKGRWSGKEPFKPSPDQPFESDQNPVAVLTRASIRPSKLWKFWQYVPVAQSRLKGYPGLMFQKGIGEMPLLQMATFSIWSDAERIRQFAYRDAEHREAVTLTRQLDWYSEELFARFHPYRADWEALEQINAR